MKISVSLNQNGYLPDQYGNHATSAEAPDGSKSFPIELSEIPTGTKSFALTLVDFDAIPVGGFPWIHWVAANIPGDTRQIPENASRSGVLNFVQGHNSTAGAYVHNTDPQVINYYANPAPPDKDHLYTLTIYALDTNLPLKTGFWMNDLYHAMQGHILATGKLQLPYRK